MDKKDHNGKKDFRTVHFRKPRKYENFPFSIILMCHLYAKLRNFFRIITFYYVEVFKNCPKGSPRPKIFQISQPTKKMSELFFFESKTVMCVNLTKKIDW